MTTRAWLVLGIIGILNVAAEERNFNRIESQREKKNLVSDFLEILKEEEDDDPYVRQTEEYCYAGDLSECFKSRALTTFSDFFKKKEYSMNEDVRIVRMPERHVQSVQKEPFDMSETPKSDDSEWDKMLKFAERKIERFLKTTAMEVALTPSATGNGTYQPRFIDEIYSELDTLEDKNEKPQKRLEIKKLFIPLLVMLKLFKLKLLLFLPFILGLASFKKILGFLAIVVPGVIGYFKICKPDLGHSYGSFGHSSFYHRPHSPPFRYDDKEDSHPTHTQDDSYSPDPHTMAYHGYYSKP